ncbi:WG repeat-containing protein [Croceiramulus getboli]|nr:WG repeat-containing protein [Flavobacteriaceae bacterium YJPT1-3]
MKTFIYFISLLLAFPVLHAQAPNNLDQVSPFHNGLAAIKKGGAWGFINQEAQLVIPFRSDLVVDEEKGFPYFASERALITTLEDDIELYGYINKTGKTVINPQFLNATPFNEQGKAIALLLTKEILGTNDLLDKNMVRYTYTEVIIDQDGKVLQYLTEPKHIIPNKDPLRKIPEIQARFISGNLVVLKNANNSWNIINALSNSN